MTTPSVLRRHCAPTAPHGAPNPVRQYRGFVGSTRFCLHRMLNFDPSGLEFAEISCDSCAVSLCPPPGRRWCHDKNYRIKMPASESDTPPPVQELHTFDASSPLPRSHFALNPVRHYRGFVGSTRFCLHRMLTFDPSGVELAEISCDSCAVSSCPPPG